MYVLVSGCLFEEDRKLLKSFIIKRFKRFPNNLKYFLYKYVPAMAIRNICF